MIKENLKIDTFLSELEKELKNSLPGKDAQKLMAPSFRIPGISHFKRKNFKESSVIILLYPVNGDLNTVFILRSPNGPHSREISLPGGKAEDRRRILGQRDNEWSNEKNSNGEER